MQTKFKRGDEVIILSPPDPEYIEYHDEDDPDFKEEEIKKGMVGRINVMLPNGKYHVEIFDSKGKTLAYAPLDEENMKKK